MRREDILELLAESIGRPMEETQARLAGLTEEQWQELHRFVELVSERAAHPAYCSDPFCIYCRPNRRPRFGDTVEVIS